MPSSIATRVGSGRHRMALSSAVIGSRTRRPYAADRGTTTAGRTLAVKLGLHIGYWGLGLTAPQQLELVLEAERLGYDSVWTAEAYGSDAATILAWLAGETARIPLGGAVFPMPPPPPAMTAM